MGLLEGLVAASVLCGLLLVALRGRPWACRLERTTAAGLAMLGLGLFWPAVHGRTSLCVALYPGAGCAGLVALPPGVHLAALAFVALGVAHCLRTPQPAPETAWPGLGHILCGLTAAGLTVDHLLVRFVLVEMTVLPTLALLLADGNRGLALWRNILLLRVAGDIFVFLVVALFGLANTWNLDAILALAGGVPLPRLSLVLLVALGAAWIKLGLPPTDGWLGDVLRCRPATRVLAAGVGLPVLGGYLLYRLRPLALAAGVGPLLIALAALALAWTLWRPSRPLGGRLLDATAALMVGLAGTDLSGGYLAALAAVRVAILAGPALPLRLTYRLVEPDRPALAGRLGRPARQGAAALRGLAALVQSQHTGLLGRNLLWACLGIAALIGLSLVWSPTG